MSGSREALSENLSERMQKKEIGGEVTDEILLVKKFFQTEYSIKRIIVSEY